MEDNNRFVDEIIDSTLAQERRAVPRQGLEARILEHVRTAASERSSRKRFWRFWVAAGAAATLVVLIVAAHVANRSQRAAVHTSQVSRAVSIPTPNKEPMASAKTTPKASTATTALQPTRTPRREGGLSHQAEAKHWPSQFPTPAPLSKVQMALVQYVRNTPPQVLAEPLLKKEAAIHPLEIEPLKISPIEIKPLAPRATRKEFE